MCICKAGEEKLDQQNLLRYQHISNITLLSAVSHEKCRDTCKLVHRAIFSKLFYWFLFSGCFTTVFKSLIIIIFAVFFTRIALLRGNEDICFNHNIQANPMKTGPKIKNWQKSWHFNKEG